MDLQGIEKELSAAITGEVLFDQAAKIAYSVDASIYEIEPLGAVCPKSEQEVFRVLEIARRYRLPIIPRGAATGITGGCIGKGLILDLSRYLTDIIEVNIEQEYVICQPGVVQDDLNQCLAPHGYRLGPDTSTGNRATIGGMLANNAAGARSLRYGKMVDHVLSVELALASGEVISFEEINAETASAKMLLDNTEGKIYRLVEQIKSQSGDEVERRFPKIPRRVSGYNLDELIKPGPLNLSKLIAGSEGTLGIALKIKLRIVPKERHTALCVVHFDDLLSAFEQSHQMLSYSPLSLEMIDHHIIEMGRLHPSLKNKLEWLIGTPAAVIVAEFDGNLHEFALQKVTHFENAMRQKKCGYAYTVLETPEKMAHVWETRKTGLGLLLSKRTYSRAIAFIEDMSLPPAELANFMTKFLAYLKSIGKEAGIYGHVGAGCMHIRPYIDLRKTEETALMQKIMLDISDLLLEHGGALSGEHGDGLVRSWLNEKMFGKEIYRLFSDIKEAFDPEGRMNPGKIVHSPPLLEHLRVSPTSKHARIDTFLDFTREGGIELAADLCNGNGLCRKSEKVMCPSFQATRDECDTTRARAQGLRAIINGRWPVEAMTGESLYRLMDLCLECKGCKTECPSQIDMAKMKSEFLYHYQQKHGTPLRSRLFGHIGLINRLSYSFASLFNVATKSSPVRFLLSYLGITPKRSLPLIAKQSFSSWVRTISQQENIKNVVLFNDTFTEFNQPEIGQSAMQVLQALNYRVLVPQWNCCGRPLISKGLLKAARKKAFKLLKVLFPYAQAGYPIIGLEPSCILTVIDDFEGLIGKKDDKAIGMLASIIPLCQTFDEFIAGHIDENGKLPLPLKDLAQEGLLHGHCHQKSLVGMDITLKVLRALPGYGAKEIPTGCCGMAGSFGYEKEHYDLSMKIAGLKLVPAIESVPGETQVIANGFSCRCQIAHATEHRALHLAEVIAQRLACPLQDTTLG